MCKSNASAAKIAFVVVLQFFLHCYLAIPVAGGMLSANYSISALNENNGSGTRSSASYQISSDILGGQPFGVLSSANYSLSSEPLTGAGRTRTGIYINNDAPYTNSPDVTLSLICGHPTGCQSVRLSTNGVSYEEALPFTLTKSITLPSIDSNRKVYAKFQTDDGEWTGACSDSIILDRQAPGTTVSPTGGVYMDPFTVTVTSSENATIYYTTDGSTPTTSSQVYQGPFEIAQDTTLKVVSQDQAGNMGSVTEQNYTVCVGSGYTITGIVTDAVTEDFMPLVVVGLDDGSEATTSAGEGRYTFNSLNRGYYTIDWITTPNSGYVAYQKEFLLCKNPENIVNYDIVLSKEAAAFGGSTNSGYSADSVNTSTGNYFYAKTDLTIPGRGIPFAFERTYNSQDDTDGPLGVGWTHNFNISLTDNGDHVLIRWGDGKVESWVDDGQGGFEPTQGVFSSLVKNQDGSYTVTQKDLFEYHFDSAGNVTAFADEYGNSMQFAYSGGNLTQITDTVGRVISLSYDTSDRLTRILDPIDRSATFSYDVNGDLVSMTNLENETTTYTYNDQHQLLTITNPLGHDIVTIVYDEQRRVVASQKDAMQSETLYSYDTAKKRTQILAPDGGITYHYFDDYLRLVKEEDHFGHTAEYVYNERGNIAQVTDKMGNVTTYEYDDNGNVTKKTDALGNVSSATFNDSNNPLTKTDANGNTTTFAYDENQSLTSVTDALGNTTSYTYDDYGQLLTETDALGNVTTKEYDLQGNVAAIIDANGARSEFTYDAVGRKLSESHPLGRGTAYEYDDMDRLVSVTDAQGGMSIFAYDAAGNKISHRDARGNTTLFEYDAKGRLIKKTDPLGNVETYEYDKMDRRKKITNALGGVSTVQYDVLGNVTSTKDPMGYEVRNEYDANGNKIKTFDPKGYETTYEYDALGRQVKTTDPLGNATTMTYDANGNALVVTDSLGNSVTNTYDALDRVLTVKDHLGNTVTNAYDKLGRMKSVTDQRGNTTAFEYDAVGNLVKVTDASGGVATAAYDALGNRTSLTDTGGNATTYAYDTLDRLTTVTTPLGNGSVMQYDEVGNLIQLTDSTGTFYYSYDKNNRLTKRVLPDLSEITYTYDALGQRTRVVDAAGATNYTFTPLGQLSSATGPFGQTVAYSYDPNGNRISVGYPGYKSVRYTYDALNRMTSVTDWNNVATTYSYDAAGNLAGEEMGNGIQVSYTYDAAGRLIAKQDAVPNSQPFIAYSLTLDPAGNRTQLDVTQPLLPELASADIVFQHNEEHQVTSDNQGRSYAYDGEGRRSALTFEEVTTQYSYSYDDMLTRVERGDDIYTYEYDSEGRRLKLVENGVETRFLLDRGIDMENVLAEMDQFNIPRTFYVYGMGLLYSVDAITNQRTYYHYDPIGSTVALSTDARAVSDAYAYLPYAGLANSSGVTPNDFTYVGKYGVMEDPSGLYFMRARYYDPHTRTFVSKDPVSGEINNPLSLNPYLYAAGNPFSYKDPEGEFVLTATAILAGAAALYVGYQVLNYVHDMHEVHKKKEAGKHREAALEAMYANLGPLPVVGEIAGVIQGIHYYKLRKPIEDCGYNLACRGTHGQYGILDFIANGKRGESNIEYQQRIGLKNGLSFDSDKLESSSKRIPGSTSSNSDLQSVTDKVLPPKNYLDSFGSARSSMRRDLSKLLDPAFLDSQTRSYVEQRITMEAYSFSRNRRYGYRDKDDKKKAKANMSRDIQAMTGRLYASLTQALSKYSVLIKDIDALPSFNHGANAGRGIYAGN